MLRWACLPLGLLLAGCDMVVMNPTGDIAVQQRNLILIATALMLVVIVPVMILTALFAWRYRASNAKATYDPDFDHSTSLELVIWAVPLLIIIILGAVTWSSTHLLDPFRPLGRIAPGRPLAPDARHLEVQVVALDWKWLFIYPEQGVASVNELALPVDMPVKFRITSTSQMNTFYAPTMAGMIYAMPGMESKLHAVVNRRGDSWGYSANYTGQGFSDMRFKLRALPRAEFDAWVARVKSGGGGALDARRYVSLEQPSEKVPAMYFGAVQPDLFGRVVNRCVEPGKPCMSDVMRRDMMRGGGHPGDGRFGAGTAPGRASMPMHGDKPTPALQKAPEDKGSGPNVTKPRAVEGSDAPGQTSPGDRRNRDMSALPSRTDHARV
jgi:cytochrome o ubiquinol oxidase subunit 2